MIKTITPKHYIKVSPVGPGAVGEIRATITNHKMAGWVEAKGQGLLVKRHKELFDLIGTKFSPVFYERVAKRGFFGTKWAFLPVNFAERTGIFYLPDYRQPKTGKGSTI